MAFPGTPEFYRSAPSPPNTTPDVEHVHSHIKLFDLVFIATVLLTAGGALPADTIDWRGKTLAVAVYPPSKLQIVGTSAEFVIGVTGEMPGSGTANGAKLRTHNAIEDSALRVARNLFVAAQQYYGVIAADDIVAQRLASPKDLARVAQGVDLVLDVSSASSVVKRPFSSRYWVNTNMSGRVVDTRTAKAFGDSFCQVVRGGDPDPLTYDELVADNAARLKSVLARQADACLQKLRADVLGIHP